MEDVFEINRSINHSNKLLQSIVRKIVFTKTWNLVLPTKKVWEINRLINSSARVVSIADSITTVIVSRQTKQKICRFQKLSLPSICSKVLKFFENVLIRLEC